MFSKVLRRNALLISPKTVSAFFICCDAVARPPFINALTANLSLFAKVVESLFTMLLGKTQKHNPPIVTESKSNDRLTSQYGSTNFRRNIYVRQVV